MSTIKNNNQKTLNDVHPFLERLLIKTYLKGKGYTMEVLKSMPEEDGKNILYQVANPRLVDMCDLMREVLIEQIYERPKLLDSNEE